MHLRGLKPIVAVLSVLALIEVPDARLAQPQSDVASLFELYRAGSYDAVQQGFLRVTQWPQFVKAAKGQVNKWPPALAAAFLLEASAERLTAHTSTPLESWNELLEMGCQLLTRSAISGAFVLQWDLASISMEEGFGTELPDHPWITDDAAKAGRTSSHVQHAIDRFPGDARFDLAKVRRTERALYWHLYVNGVRAASREPVSEMERLIATSGRKQMIQLADEFYRFRIDPLVRVDGTLRAAFWKTVSGNQDEAIRLAVEVDTYSEASDWDRYLARLFRGRALSDLNRHAEAIQAYEEALKAWPGDAARMALSASLFLQNKRDQAALLMTSLLGSPPPTRDPWGWHPFGDYRYWPERLQGLRDMLR
jgi:hypothetical protein